MPLSKKQFAEIVKALGPDAPPEMIIATAQAVERKLPDFSPGEIPAPEDPSLLGSAADAVVPPALRVGGAIAGGALAGGSTLGLGTAAGAAGGGALGELLAEAYEKARGMREGINPTQIAVQGGLSAVPGLRSASVLRRAAMGAALGGAGTAATQAAEGEEIDPVSVLAGAGVGGALGAVPVRGATPRTLVSDQDALAGGISQPGSRGLPTGKSPSRQLSDAEMIDAALAALEQSPGATINRFGGDLAGQPYYAVGKFRERNVKVPGQLTRQDLQDYIEQNRTLLDDPENSLGIWVPEGGPIDLDVSGTPGSLVEALRIAQRKPKGPVGVLTRGEAVPEEAVYDLRFAPSKAPEKGNIKVRPSLSPRMNALVEQERGSLELAGARRRTGDVVERQSGLPFANDDNLQLSTPKDPGATAGVVPAKRPGVLPNRPFPEPSVLDDLYHTGESGAKWYDETKTAIERMLGKDRADRLIDMLAATSPNASVKANVQLAIKALEQFEADEEFSGFMGNVMKDLRKAAKGDTFGGKKVQAFARALKGDPDAVVVDRWVMRAFGFPEGKSPSPKIYDKIASVITERAKELGVEPRQYQAALWKGAKDIAGRPGDTALPFEEVFHEMAGQRPLFNPEGLKRLFPPSEKVALEHRTNVEGLKEIDPQFFGTSMMSGAERKRAERYPESFLNRSFFTKKGEPFEAKLKSKRYLYEGAAPSEHVYDQGRDPLRLWEQAQILAKGEPQLAQNLFEKLVQQRGFWGYEVSSHPDPRMRSVVVMFKKLPVKLRGVDAGEFKGEYGKSTVGAARAPKK